MQVSLRGLGETLGNVTGMFGTAASYAVKYHEAVLGLTAAYGAFRLASKFLPSGAAFGPVGIAVSALAGGITYLATTESNAEKQALKYGIVLGDLEEQYNRLKKSSDAYGNSVENITAEQKRAEEDFLQKKKIICKKK